MPEPIVRLDPAAARVEEFGDWVDPLDALAAAGDRGHPVLLLSGQPDHPAARHSILAADPILVCDLRGDRARLARRDGGAWREEIRTVADPFELIRDLAPAGPAPRAAAGLPFVGGAIGWLGYGLRHAVERLPERAPDPLGHPVLWLGVYDAAVIFDHRERRVALVTAGLRAAGGTDGSPAGGEAAARRPGEWRRLLERARTAGHDGRKEPHGSPDPGGFDGAAPGPMPGVRFAVSRDRYLAQVRRALQDIAAGDVYQVNLSHRITCLCPALPLPLFVRLARRNPAPFAAYLDTGDLQVLCTSPERLVSLRGDRVVSSPIKGTRPRFGDPAADERLRAELRDSPKDRAENVMIADLVRNDLGRVCKPGSVRVETLCGLESFATVHHLVSTIAGTLRADRDRVDLLRALFPGGSMTGAPKVRAMEIIDELEQEERGIYSGSIGYLSADGSIDFNIVIRTAVCSGGLAHFRVGGGVVADSDPEAEWRETLDKARALLDVFGG